MHLQLFEQREVWRRTRFLSYKFYMGKDSKIILPTAGAVIVSVAESSVATTTAVIVDL